MNVLADLLTLVAVIALLLLPLFATTSFVSGGVVNGINGISNDGTR